MRLLNCALWHLRERRVEHACECLAGAASCGADAKTLAALAATCTRSIAAAELDTKEKAQLYAAARVLCERALDSVRVSTGKDIYEMREVLADLCVAVADVGGLAPHVVPAAWAAWALQHVPHAKLDTLFRLVLHCKAGATPSVQQQYDANVKASPHAQTRRPGSGLPS